VGDEGGACVTKRESKPPATAGAKKVSAPPSLMRAPSGYAEWLAEVKTRISEARRRAVVAANLELVRIYWELGRDILARQENLGWGAKVIEKLAHDLRIAFPEMRGFSRANLMYMRAFAEAWPDAEIVQQLVGQLSWGRTSSWEAQERDVEQALVTHISRFLLEPGAGFAFVGRQVHLEVGGEDFYIEPEHAGRLNFYLSAVDSQVRGEHDNPAASCCARPRTA
jgi:predicted nuclease of restriction endonuclease-like (RecB) superfamily